MDYKYDVFISYKNHDLTIDWIKQFEKRFSYWLTQSLGGKKAKIFFDKDSIETGSKWPKRLQDGLKYSKTIVCIWTPEYFQSKWCLSEWKSFEEREKQCGEGLNFIFPIRFHDGEHYPENAKNRQCLDVRNFSSTMEAFWKSARAIDLDFMIQDFSEEIAKIIREVPAYSDEFPVLIEEEEQTPIVVPHIKL